MPTFPFQVTRHDTQTVDIYNDNIDADFNVLERVGAAFAPHAQAVPNMTIALDAGALLNGTILTEVENQNTSIIIAPTNNQRIDRVVIDWRTGVASVIEGDEAVSPEPPEIPVNTYPIAQVFLQTTSTTITNEMITDERVVACGSSSNTISLTGKGGTSYTYAVSDQACLVQRSNSGSSMEDVLPGTGIGVMPAGWMVIVSNNDDSALLAVIVGSGASLIGASLGYILLGPDQSAVITSDGSNYNVVRAPERTRLGGNTTLYVTTAGSDLNTGLTSSDAFASLQHALNTVVNCLDLGGYSLIVQLADGTYTNGVSLTKPWVGGSSKNVIISGNSENPAQVILSTSGTVAYAEGAGCGFTIHSLKMQSSSGGLLWADRFADIYFSNVIFDSASGNHLTANASGYLYAYGHYTITGSATRHMWSGLTSIIRVIGKTITLSGTPSFTSAFAHASICGTTEIYGDTFSGVATGKRYEIKTNGVIYTAGGGASYLPGNAVGTVETGGQYA